MGEPTLLPCPFCGSRGEWYGPSVGCSSDTCPALLVPAKGVERAEEAWNRRAPNPLAATLAARDERIRELEIRADAAHLSLDSMREQYNRQLARTFELKDQLAAAKDVAEQVAYAHRQEVGMYEAEAQRIAVHVATLERELAEARQRDEDATDLILRQGRELDAMRPKAEAAERRAAWLVRDQRERGGYDLSVADLVEFFRSFPAESDQCDADILAACPEKGGAE